MTAAQKTGSTQDHGTEDDGTEANREGAQASRRSPVDAGDP